MGRDRTADTKKVTEQVRTERAVHTTRIAQLEGNLHDLKGTLDFAGRRSNVAELQ